MITLFEVDKSGCEIFEKDYSIAIVKNKEVVYGINVPQNIRDILLHLFNSRQIKMNSTNSRKEKLRFKIRTHVSLIIYLIREAIKEMGYVDKIRIEICNDIDGHFNEIKDMIYKNLCKLIPTLEFDDIVQTKFSKTSLVDKAAKNLRERNKEQIINYIIPKINIDELIKLIKK